MKFLLSLLLVILIAFNINAQQPIITTIAGLGPTYGSNNADGILALDASLGFVKGIAIDDTGNVYIASDQQRVRKITPGGYLYTTAGTGAGGYSGDGGLATEAWLFDPSGVLYDEVNNWIYISDDANRIRKVDMNTGIITLVAGNGQNSFSGDGGLATLAALKYPKDMALDLNGDLLIVDAGNFRIRKVNRTTGIITTIAGTGQNVNTGNGGPAAAAGLFYPDGIAVDPTGNIYVTCATSVRKIEYGTTIISNLADGLFSAQGVCTDSVGNVYFSDADGGRIKKVSYSTGAITTIAGNGNITTNTDGVSPLQTGMGPLDIETRNGKMYVIDIQPVSFRIRVFNLPKPLVAAHTVISGCNGETNGSITVNATGGMQPYQYSLTGQTYQNDSLFTGLATGSYYVYLKDATGEVQIDTINIANGVAPTANYTYSHITLSTVNFTNTSTAADSVLWLFPDNFTSTETNPTYQFPGQGEYEVSLIAYNGCGVDTFTMTVNILAGIEENIISTINLYPNPAGDDVAIQLNATRPVKGSLQILNTLGQVVYSEQLNFNSTYTKTIDISSFAGGLYMVALQTEKGNMVRKLIVE